MESQNEDFETNSKNNLKHFIEKSKQRLAAILAICQWNEQDVLKNFNTNHLPKEDKIDPNDLPLPDSFPSLNSVVIDRTELQNLLNTPEAENPKRFSDIQINFTRVQKLLLYEYVISKTGKCSEPELTVPVLNETKNLSNDMTFAEIVAKKKREKKLRRKYRTSKPTHIEEVRNLVELQMQALEQYFKSTNKTRERRHRSRSRDRSRRNYSPMKYKNQRSYSEQSKYFGHRRRSRSCDFRDRNRRSRERTRDRSRERNYDKSRERSRTRSHRRSSKEIIQNEKIRQISSIEEERGSCVKKRKKNQIKHSKKRKSKSPKHDKKHKKKRKKEKSDKKEKTKHVEIKDEIKIKSEPESTTETE